MLDARTIRATTDELLKQARTAPEGIAFKIMVTRPDGNEQIAVRVKSGIGEWHHDYADVMFILEGKGEIVTGGEIIGGKQTAPGEIRGEGVKDGQKQAFGPGDVIRVEPRTAHQMLLAPGSVVRYFIVKIKA